MQCFFTSYFIFCNISSRKKNNCMVWSGLHYMLFSGDSCPEGGSCGMQVHDLVALTIKYTFFLTWYMEVEFGPVDERWICLHLFPGVYKATLWHIRSTMYTDTRSKILRSLTRWTRKTFFFLYIHLD